MKIIIQFETKFCKVYDKKLNTSYSLLWCLSQNNLEKKQVIGKVKNSKNIKGIKDITWRTGFKYDAFYLKHIYDNRIVFKRGFKPPSYWIEEARKKVMDTNNYIVDHVYDLELDTDFDDCNIVIWKEDISVELDVDIDLDQ